MRGKGHKSEAIIPLHPNTLLLIISTPACPKLSLSALPYSNLKSNHPHKAPLCTTSPAYHFDRMNLNKKYLGNVVMQQELKLRLSSSKRIGIFQTDTRAERFNEFGLLEGRRIEHRTQTNS